MALSSKSLILYGFQVTPTNASIDFRSVAAETPRKATLNVGYYSLTSLATEIARAMRAVDLNNSFTVTVDRTVAAGLQNRVTISSTSSVLELLGATGPRAATSALALIGFGAADYTGATSYTGSSSAGTVLIPTRYAYNYRSPDEFKQVQGTRNISASGVKEAIVFGLNRFIEAEFRYEPRSRIVPEWKPFMEWAIQQRLFEITPEIATPSTFYEVSLDKTEADGNGLGYKLTEMLPLYPNLYRTGLLTLRVTN